MSLDQLKGLAVWLLPVRCGLHIQRWVEVNEVKDALTVVITVAEAQAVDWSLFVSIYKSGCQTQGE